MAKHIGIVGCSAEGAALCYRTICAEGPAMMGEHNHPEITMHTLPLSMYMKAIYVDDWEQVAGLMVVSAKKLAEAGADFAICPDNTIHQPFESVLAGSPLPWLHIAEVAGAEAQRIGAEHIGVLGTKYLMTGPVYTDALKKFNITSEIPDKADRLRIDNIIFKELVNGIFPESSRLFFNDVISKFKDNGCQAVVLGCTEIPLIVDPEDCPLPTLDSNRLLARAALKKAMEIT
ncbi:aspartate/glutamate racemase family protein [Candidatus Latescibacterota bacterium]